MNTTTAPTYEVFLEDALSIRLPPSAIPSADIPEGLTAIEGPRRMSLVSRRPLSAPFVRERLETVDLSALTPPTPIFGPARVVRRAANETRDEMVVLACRVENHDELHAFVDQIFELAGLRRPERRFVFHLTLANNAGGHPYGSIAYLKPSDFEGPDLLAAQSFTPRTFPPTQAADDSHDGTELTRKPPSP